MAFGILMAMLMACMATTLAQDSWPPQFVVGASDASLSLKDIALISKQHRYKMQILSKDPLMIYLDEFLHPSEARYLIERGFEPSKVYAQSQDTEEIHSARTSHSTTLGRYDPIVSLVKDRAQSLLGFLPFVDTEAFQMVRYYQGQEFQTHNDAFDSPILDKTTGVLYNRAASFFIYLEANCSSGATYFPRVPPPPENMANSDRFSTIENRTGLMVLPRVGSGIFWLNLMDNGTVDERVAHAGLPVTSGSKIGLNIWVMRRA